MTASGYQAQENSLCTIHRGSSHVVLCPPVAKVARGARRCRRAQSLAIQTLQHPGAQHGQRSSGIARGKLGSLGSQHADNTRVQHLMEAGCLGQGDGGTLLGRRGQPKLAAGLEQGRGRA